MEQTTLQQNQNTGKPRREDTSGNAESEDKLYTPHEAALNLNLPILWTDAVTEGLIRTALAIASKRRDILERLREALQQGDNAQALELAKELCGGTHEEKSTRTDPCIDERPSR